MKAIVAVSKNWAIGNKGGMLFRLKEDMQFFKETTLGKVVVMGRKTLESFKDAKPLPNRTNIVLSRHDLQRSDIVQCTSLDELAKTLSAYDADDVFNIGGSEVYQILLPYCNEAYVTKVDSLPSEADSFFPNLDETENWQLVFEDEEQDDSGHMIKFCIYKNTSAKEFIQKK